MLNPAYQPRRQQPGQLVALGKRPVSELRVMRQNLRLLIRPCRDSTAHKPTLNRDSAARQPDQPPPSASSAGAVQGMVTSVTQRTGKRNTGHHESQRQHRRMNAMSIATRVRPNTPSAERRHFFTTEAILNGMPPHIAQLILGHKDINTTMGYKAVYPEEAINGHRAFIARRRELRPSEEYRAPTDSEWEEFLGHFERRRLALGDCGRAYGTSCIHELVPLTELTDARIGYRRSSTDCD